MRNPLHNPTQSCRLLIYVKNKTKQGQFIYFEFISIYICPDKDYMLKTMLQLNFDRCEN